MWVQMNELMKSGTPYTDACEMAERENLMLEPEDEVLTEDREILMDPYRRLEELLNQ
jgi:hypothetical protein